MSVLVDSILLGDIGATNARFSLLSNGNLNAISRFEVAKFGQFTDALAVFIKEHCRQTQIHKALLAIAGPVKGQRVALTNTSWVIDISELQTVFGLAVRIVNDFEAVALSIPNLTSTDLVAMGGGRSELGAPIAVLGPGTGLGVACLVDRSDRRVVIASEGGHATLAPTCEQEDRIVNHLRKRFGHVSAERVISGSGLENIYQAIATLEGLEFPPRNAAEITKNALSGECQLARRSLQTFCAFLGSFAGNVALTFGARGGVYIAGGISPRILDFLVQSEFRRRFEAKGRFREYLAAIPSYVITHPAAALIGLRSLVESGASNHANYLRNTL
ncbi:MAG: glucokinase [Rhizobiales bacterium]|nr:glucokinase [Hyphomicrobiales bacterium]